MPALTLGCGAVGGSATSDNVSPLNLINIRRVARGLRELSDLRGAQPAAEPPCACPSPAPADCACPEKGMASLRREAIAARPRAGMARLGT